MSLGKNFLLWLEEEIDRFQGLDAWLEREVGKLDKYIDLLCQEDLDYFCQAWGVTREQLETLKDEFRAFITPVKLSKANCIDKWSAVYLENSPHDDETLAACAHIIADLGLDDTEAKKWISNEKDMKEFGSVYRLDEQQLRDHPEAGRAYWKEFRERKAKRGTKLVMKKARLFGNRCDMDQFQTAVPTF